jgi:hypothetical protein
MRLLLEAVVKSRMLLTETITLRHQGQEYAFHRADDGTFEKISICAPVPDPARFYMGVGSGKGAPLSIGTDTHLTNQLRGELQDFEGLFALAFNLVSIGWGAARLETIAESDEEVEPGIFAYEKTRRIPGDGPIDVPREALLHFVERRNRYSELRVPLSFWRVGNNELRAFRFINAFFNFYFVLEGLYANGKTGANEVKKQFQRSLDLQEIITGVLPLHLNVGQLPNPLSRLLAEVGEEASLDGVISMLIKVRGQLHHYSHGSTKRQGSPLTQDIYDSAAFLSGNIATHALRRRLAKIDNRFESPDVRPNADEG